MPTARFDARPRVTCLPLPFAGMTEDFCSAQEFYTDRSCNAGGGSYLNMNGG